MGNMSNITVGIITNKEYYMDLNVNVLVGTPNKLEEYLVENYYNIKKTCQFDYVIFDEIQMLNSMEGKSFENIIKLIECPFLVLSATIKDPKKLQNWLKEIKKKDVNLVEYNNRFIVQQRYLWNNNELQHLHPLSCLDKNYIKSVNFLKSELSF